MKHYYLKKLIGDNGDFVVALHVNELNQLVNPNRTTCWMVPGTWDDRYDESRIERFNNCVTISKKGAKHA